MTVHINKSTSRQTDRQTDRQTCLAALFITDCMLQHSILRLFRKELTDVGNWKHNLFQSAVLADNLENVSLTALVDTTTKIIPHSGKLSRNKTFANWRKI